MREPITLTLGETAYTVRPLTAGAVEKLERVVSSVDGSITKAIDTIAIVLERDNPNVQVRDIEVGPRDLVTAYTRILRHAGFVEASPDSPTAAAALTNATNSGDEPAAA